MNRIVLALALCLLPITAHAFSFEWTPSTGATSFDIEQAVFTVQADGRYTMSPWVVVRAAVPISLCTRTKCTEIIAPPGPLVLYRITTYFATGVKSTRTYSGAWYSADWLIPGTAGSAEIR